MNDFTIKIVPVEPISRALPTHVRRALLGVEKVPIGPEELENWFTYHAPSPDQLPKYEMIRAKALEFAKAIVNNTPPSADQTVAIRKVREAVMIANASIACGGK
jgi:hypothetical protein